MIHKKKIFILIILCMVYVLFESSCFVAEQLLARYKQIKYCPLTDKLVSDILNKKDVIKDLISERIVPRKVYDSQLGWNVLANLETPWEIIKNGIRDEKVYSYHKSKGVIRMLAFGDSFTYGEECSNKSIWEKFLNDSGNIEVLNFGVPGYGLDQAYLRYLKEGKKYETDYVLIGFIAEDANRQVNTFRYFYTPYEWYWSKPRYYLENGKLKLLENYFQRKEDIMKLVENPRKTIAELGERDYFYQTRFYSRGFFDFLPSVRLFKVLFSIYREQMTGMLRNEVYRSDSEAFQITVKTFDAFVDDVKKAGAVPIIMMFPEREDFYRRQSGRTKRYEVFLKHFQEKGYYYFDAMDAFDKQCPKCDVSKLINNHYSPLGNMIVAQGFIEYYFKNVHR